MTQKAFKYLLQQHPQFQSNLNDSKLINTLIFMIQKLKSTIPGKTSLPMYHNYY